MLTFLMIDHNLAVVLNLYSPTLTGLYMVMEHTWNNIIVWCKSVPRPVSMPYFENWTSDMRDTILIIATRLTDGLHSSLRVSVLVVLRMYSRYEKKPMLARSRQIQDKKSPQTRRKTTPFYIWDPLPSWVELAKRSVDLFVIIYYARLVFRNSIFWL